jgi:hypothetical protein
MLLLLLVGWRVTTTARRTLLIRHVSIYLEIFINSQVRDNESAQQMGVVKFDITCHKPLPSPLLPKWLKDKDNSVLFEMIATSPVSWWREDLPENNWALDPTDQSKR